MNTHYIPQLMLRPFADEEHINTYDFTTKTIEYKKIKNTFSGSNLFDEELEKLFATKLEGPFGNLLNHKLLKDRSITLNRQENLLMRKMLMINFLRAPIVNTDWDEMIERTKSKDHPSVQAAEFIMRHHPETKSEFDEVMHSAENYIENLKKAMDIDSLEDLSSGSTELGISKSLANAARRAMVSVIAFWDSTDAGEEFILPKLPGITEMDYVSILHKTMVLQARRNELEEEWLPDDMDMEIKRMLYGSAVFSENYSVYPISPTRCIICFSPYFRAFFPTRYAGGKENVYPPLLKENQFYNSFYISPRIELFEPCEARFNKSYLYQVKQLTRDEVYYIDSMLLDMETEEFAFHEIDRIKNSLWYYDNQAVFAGEKKHDFSNLYS